MGRAEAAAPHAVAGVGRDQAGVNGEAFPADQALGHAAADHGLEQLAQQIALAEAAVPVLGEGRVVRHVTLQPEAAEPAVGQVEVDLLDSRRSERMPKQ